MGSWRKITLILDSKFPEDRVCSTFSFELSALSTDPSNKKLPRSRAFPFLNEEAQSLEWERKNQSNWLLWLACKQKWLTG